MYEIVFLDTETTGIHPEREIWELAMIGRTKGGEESAPFVLQVANVDLSKADPFGLQIGGFYKRYYKYNDSVDITSVRNNWAVAEKVEKFTRGAHIVGAVPNFDTESLDKLLRRNELLPAWHYHLIDVENLAVGYLMGTNGDQEVDLSLPWKSDDLSRAIGVEPPSKEERHTALGDIRWAMRIYDRVVGIK